MSSSKSDRKITKSIDSLSVMELAVLIGGFCGEQTKYFRYDRNLRLAWRVLLKANQAQTVYGRIGFTDPRSSAPKEAVAALKKLLKKGRISDDRISYMLNQYVDKSYWDEKLTKETKAAEDKHFNAFLKACVSYVNNYQKGSGVTLTMPKAKATSKED